MIQKSAFLNARSSQNSYWLLPMVLVLTICSSLAKSTQTGQYAGLPVLDSDKDGLGNSLEAELKTDPKVVDRDGDGLSDFQEIHKYLTDPAKKDTDGDGVSDGNWNERREYTYSVRSILRFMPPFDKNALNDDFQDALLLKKRDDYIELEIIHYPLATAYESMEENPNWQQDYAGMTEYLRPGVTTNWDAKMKRDVLAELKADGIVVDELTDKKVVREVSSWLMKKSRSLNDIFTTYYVHFPNGQPSIYPGLEDAFKRHKGKYGWTNQQQFEHELFGRGMFYHKTHGSCTSTAVYLTTVLRTVGIPTRMIIAIPSVDPSDEDQVRLVRERIAHNQVRQTMLAALGRSGQSFAAHTYNEVYVGNRWHRLNYNKLGQSVLDKNCLGLHTHLYTLNDLSEARLALTWGWRYAKGERSAIFKHSNPYSAVTISDLFGCHSNIPNPPFTTKDISSSPLPNIFIMSPSDISMFREILEIVEDVTWNKTGRSHKRKFYDEIFIDRIHNKKSGDIIVLLFSLDTDDRIPTEYEDLLPVTWSAIELALKQGKTLELKSEARQTNIIVLAAPNRNRLSRLISESSFLRVLKAVR